MIANILVLGAGSAGLLAALTLRRRFPQLGIRVVQSPDIGVIGVGEGTTPAFPQFLFYQLGLHPARFYDDARPTWKLGLRFLWGPRPEFFYIFSRQFNFRRQGLPRNNGFYCEEDVEDLDLWSALARRNRALPRKPDGGLDFARHQTLAFHIENKRLVDYLEARCREIGVTFTAGTVRQVERGERGVSALVLESGERLSADLYVDASGFRAELLGRTFAEPFRSFDRSLFCDRAVMGGWARTDEPIKPYTTAETMDAGWCWQIEHENWINRGYVYASRFISDDAARTELLGKNPKISNEPRVVKFRSGRYERMWVDNVVGIGNASGFVEPLEATALVTIIVQCRALADCLWENALEPTPSMIAIYNRFIGESWDEVRDFIALHYRFNHRLDTPFWRTCLAETELGNAQTLVDFYRENGPTSLHEPLLLRPSSTFGMEGYLALLIGQKVPHQKPHQPTARELEVWQKQSRELGAAAERGLTVREGLDLLRRPDVQWDVK